MSNGSAFTPKTFDGLATSWEAMAPFEDAAKGYRERMVRAGWSRPAAEVMAVHYFGLLVAMASGQQPPATPPPGGASLGVR